MPLLLQKLFRWSDDPARRTLQKAALISFFSVLVCCLFALLTGHGFLNSTFGVNECYSFFVYEGQALRDLLRSLLAGTAQVEQFSFFEGYGTDVLLAMSGCVTDPLNLLSVLVPKRFTEYAYVLLMLVRVVLAGMAFCAYCLHRGSDEQGIGIGVTTYVTSGFVLMLATLKYPPLLNMAIWLPLALLEVDRLFEGSTSWRLALVMGWAAILSPMLALTSALMLLGYTAVRLVFDRGGQDAEGLIRLALRILLRLVLAAAAGMICILPLCLHIASLQLTGQGLAGLWHSARYYLRLLPELVGMAKSGSVRYVGMVPVVLYVAYVLCGSEQSSKGYRAWVMGIPALLVVTVLAPLEHAFDGPVQMAGGWAVMLTFCLSYVSTIAVPVLFEAEEARVKLARIVTLTLLVFGVLVTMKLYAGIAFLVAVAIAGLGYLLVPLCRFPNQDLVKKMVQGGALVCSVLVTWLYLSSAGGGYADDLAKFGKAWSAAREGRITKTVDWEDLDKEYRYVQSREVKGYQNGLISKLLTSTGYAASYDQPVQDFRASLGLYQTTPYGFMGNDNRTAVDTLLGTKYYVTTEKDGSPVPVQFTSKLATKSKLTSWEADNALPIAFLYRDTISTRDYEALDMAGRQEALLKGCVLDGESTTAALDATSAKASWSVASSSDVLLADGRAETKNTKGKLELAVDGAARSETYLCLKGLAFTGTSKGEAQQAFGEPSTGLSNALDTFFYEQPTSYKIRVTVGDDETTYTFRTPTSDVWMDRTDWLLNLGYHEEPVTSVTVEFLNRGVYTWDAAEVVCQPIQPVLDAAANLRDGAADGIKLETNAVSATFDVPAGGGYAFFSVPYSKGWSAQVDGAPAEVLQADVGFMAVRLDKAGAHEVRLTYRTPGLKEGALISAGAIALLVGLFVVEKRRAAVTD